MLAVNCEHLNTLTFPVLATPKLDGIRCLKINGRALTRSFKPISNDYVRRETTSIIGREKGTPDFVFHIFDYVSAGISEPYAQRMINLIALDLPEQHTQKVLPELCKDLGELAEFESQCVAEGFEGVMIRTPSSPYKCGRSTENEGYLLKIKRFEDLEATVLDTYEGGVDRLSLWQRRGELIGKLVKFKHQPSGAKDAPHFPQFIGFREAWDL